MSPSLAASERRLQVSKSVEVSALLVSPARPDALYVLAHGAGAGMRHAFMETMAARLAARGVATLRYQFPYVENGSRPIATAARTGSCRSGAGSMRRAPFSTYGNW